MYRISHSGVQRDDGKFIPADPGNTDYVAYLAWVAAGNTATPMPEHDPVVPRSVSRYQARAALLDAGLLAEVEAYFSGLPETSLARLAWQEAPTVNRGSDALIDAAEALGLTGGQLDALFLRGAQFV
jgi:hypothetical protein